MRRLTNFFIVLLVAGCWLGPIPHDAIADEWEDVVEDKPEVEDDDGDEVIIEDEDEPDAGEQAAPDAGGVKRGLGLSKLEAAAEEKRRAEEKKLARARRAAEAKVLHDAAITLSTREAIAKAVNFLRERAKKNYHGLILPPRGVRKIISTERIPYQVRYREEKYIRKIPIYKYEMVDAIGYRSGHSTATGRSIGKRKIRKIVGIKSYREEKATRLIRDPKGRVRRTHHRLKHTYEKGESKFIMQPGFLGHNAMALHILLKAGVPPDDPLLVKQVNALQAYVEAYGMPDATYDVAWLTAAFCAWPERTRLLVRLRRQLITKLCYGQVSTGRETGMWGPVSQDVTLLSLLAREELRVGNTITGLKAELKAKPKSRLLARRLAIAEAEKHRLLKFYRPLTCRAQRVTNVTAAFEVDPDPAAALPVGFVEFLDRMRVSPLQLDYIHDQTADMENTAWALLGLREAALNGSLPETVTRPVISRRIRLKPRSTRSVLRKAAAAIAQAYKRRLGGWDEANCHAVVTDFEKHLGLRLERRPTYYLYSAHYPINDAQAYSAFVSLSDALGLGGMKPYRTLIQRSETLAAKHLEAIFPKPADEEKERTGKTKKKKKPVRFSLQSSPHDLLFYLAGVHRSYVKSHEPRRQLWFHTANELINQQRPDGSWGGGAYRFMSTSAMELHFEKRMATLKQRHDAQKYDNPKYRATLRRQLRHHNTYLVYDSYRAFATLFTIHYLASAVRPAICAHWQWQSDPPKLRTLIPALNALYKSTRIRLTTLELKGPIPHERLPYIPLIIINGTAQPPPAQKNFLRELREFLSADGILVLETPGTRAGWALFKHVEGEILRMFPTARKGTIPSDMFFPGRSKRSVPKLRGVLAATGEAMLVFLPLGKRNTSTLMTTRRASRALAQILRTQAPDIANAGYPVFEIQRNEIVDIVEAEDKTADSADTKQKEAEPASPAEPAPPKKKPEKKKKTPEKEAEEVKEKEPATEYEGW